MLKKASFYAFVLGFLCASAYAQLWPTPSYTTPDTPVACTLCPGTALNMPTPGWHDPVVRYVGRFVSSEYVADFQLPYRTARAGGIVMTPDESRIGVKLGQGIATYDAASFLSKLDSHTPLTSGQVVGVTPCYRSFGSCDGYVENFLMFDRYFYAENSATGWLLAFTDGQDRLNQFDMDDRGLIYAAYRQFGWGVASDLPTTLAASNPPLMSSWQDKNSFKNWAPATQAYWVKDGSDYYALAQNSSQAVTHVFKVPSYSSVTETTTLSKPVLYLARGNNNKTAVVSSSTQLGIYDNHSLVTNGQPTQAFDYTGYSISSVAYDGTNWWVNVLTFTSGIHFMLSRISPNGVGFTRTDFPATSYGGALSMRLHDGYLSAVTSDADGLNIRLYKVSSGTPIEQPQLTSVNAYFKTTAGFAPLAAHMSIGSADPFVVGGKLYLIVNADGIGDVYQIRTDDTVNIAFQGTAGAVNGNAPARAAGDVFYGDTVKLTGTLSSGAAGGTMTWNFGAPHDPANTQTGTFGVQTTHQYTGLTKADTASPLTITGTNPANGVTGTSQITLKTGTARVKYGSTAGTKYLTGSGTPVVMDDSFYDASDGDTNGHYPEWRIGADLATITAPGFVGVNGATLTPQPVGTCGQHTLSMTAHYGYASFGANNVDFASTIAAPFTYNVAAFAPGADVTYNSATGNEEFFSTSRAAAALAGRTFTYTWDVVDSNGTAVATIAPQSGTTTSVDTIPRYPVSKALFTQAGFKGRLTLSVSGVDPCSQTGAPMASQQATSGPLVTPDAQLNASCAVGVCTYTITSPSNVLLSDAWTFAWTTTGGSPSSGTGASLTTSYFTAGNFPVQVIVTNKTGLTKTVTYTANITTPASQCPTFTPLNTFISHSGTTCPDGGTCQPNDQITFALSFFQLQVDQSCLNTMTYAWLVDGAAAGTASTLTTSFATSSTHVVALTLKAGTQTLNLSHSINIGAPPPPPPPPTPTCPAFANPNVYIDFTGQSPNCALGGTCTTSDAIGFTLKTFGFSPGSCTLSYTWSYDGSAAVAGGSQVSHTFTTAGSHTVVCHVSNASSQAVASVTVNVSGSTTPPPTCPALVSGRNVFFDYKGASSNCASTNSKQCTAGEQLTFTVTYYQYDNTCGTHTYAWKVDGAAIQATTDTTPLTLTQGSHTVSVTIDNGNVPATTLSQTLNIANGATPTYTFDFTMKQLADPPFSYSFTVTVTPDANKPTQWQWNFGDGAPAVTAGATQTHTFPDDKQYTITVTALDGSGSVSHTLPAAPARRRGVRH